MDERLCKAAIEGSVDLLHEVIKDDPLILDKIVMGSISGSPLHTATTRGHVHFVKDLLLRNPELAEVLDSRQQSALHLAAAKGHLSIAQALVEASREMCLARDRDGRNPLHVAAANGKVAVLEMLVRESPCAARARVDRDETILHLCVKHKQFSTLELLLNDKKISGPEFVNAKDSDGNTILHLSVSEKQSEIIGHLLKTDKVSGELDLKIEVNATNASNHTAMDILFLSQSKKSDGAEKEIDGGIEDFLLKANGKRAKDIVQDEWLAKKKDTLVIVASLIATMAFQAVVSPPGGVWQDDSNGHRAGEAVMAYNHPHWYPYFLRSNTIGFVASLSTILLLISGLPFRKREFLWILVLIMWLTITSMSFTYAFANIVVTPQSEIDKEKLSHTIWVAVIVWCSVMVFLLLCHTFRFIVGLMREKRSKRKAIERILNGKRWSLRGGGVQLTEQRPRSVVTKSHTMV